MMDHKEVFDKLEEMASKKNYQVERFTREFMKFDVLQENEKEFSLVDIFYIHFRKADGLLLSIFYDEYGAINIFQPNLYESYNGDEVFTFHKDNYKELIEYATKELGL